MASQKVVPPVKTGIQFFSNYPKPLDFGYRRDDGMLRFMTFCQIIKFDSLRFHQCWCHKKMLSIFSFFTYSHFHNMKGIQNAEENVFPHGMLHSDASAFGTWF
jgi:hypothetical protein